MMMQNRTSFREFVRREDGNTVVEFVISFPILVGWLIVCMVYFDAYKSQYDARKATYAIGDMLARYSVLEEDTLNDMGDLLAFMIPSEDGDIEFRVSSIECPDTGCIVDWCYIYGDTTYMPMTIADIPTVLPPANSFASVLVVETRVPYQPSLGSLGIGVTHVDTMIITEPAFRRVHQHRT